MSAQNAQFQNLRFGLLCGGEKCESLRSAKSLATRLESAEAKPEPSRMGFDLPTTAPGERLIIARKEHTPRSIALDKAQLTIGRADENDIVLNDKDVSRQHARLERTPSGWQVIDLGSTNGTYLEGNSLLAGIPEALPAGKTIRIGPYFLHWQKAELPTPPENREKSGSLLPSGATAFQSKLGDIGVNVQPPRLEILPLCRER